MLGQSFAGLGAAFRGWRTASSCALLSQRQKDSLPRFLRLDNKYSALVRRLLVAATLGRGLGVFPRKTAPPTEMLRGGRHSARCEVRPIQLDYVGLEGNLQRSSKGNIPTYTSILAVSIPKSTAQIKGLDGLRGFRVQGLGSVPAWLCGVEQYLRA